MEDHSYFQGSDGEGLYLIRPPRRGLRYTCDIFIVHGLNGGSCKTWRHPDTNNIWFRDLLPDYVKDEVRGTNARIWTYGYNAQAAFQSAAHQAGAFTFARDLLQRVKMAREGYENHKIIWVCHSLGGIVVKTALIQANSDESFKPILNATVGIVFMGTPHGGSDMAKAGDRAARVAEAMLPSLLFRHNRDLVSSLRKDSSGLFQTAYSFTRICTSMKIYSFFELLPQTGNRIVVEERSAVVNLPNEVSLPLNANHRNMCKFRDNDDQNFSVVRSSICELMKLTIPPRAPQLPLQSPPPRPNNFYPQPSYDPNDSQYRAPYPPDTVYVDRKPVPRSSHPTPPIGPSDPSYHNQHQQPSVSPAPAVPPSINEPVNSVGGRFTATSSVTGGLPFGASRSTPYHHVPNPAHSTENLWRSYSGNSSTTSQNFQNLSVPHGQTHQRSASQPTLPTDTRIQDQVQTSSAPFEGNESAEDSCCTCDACKNSILLSRPRVHCLECEDYDLCESCFQIGRVSLSHRSDHQVYQILRTHRLGFEDLTSPDEKVDPEFSPGGARRNWTVQGDVGQEIRWFHLYQNNSHARFLSTGIEPGHYAVTFILSISVSDELTSAHKQQLGSTGLGQLQAFAGIPKNRRQFHNERFIEDDGLKDKLFNQTTSHLWKIPVESSARSMELNGVLHVESTTSGTSEMSFLLQWSSVRSFNGRPNTSLVQISLLEVRLEDLLEYDDNARSSSTEQPAESDSTPATSTSSATTENASDETTVALGDILQAILEEASEQRSQEEREAFNAALQSRLREREREQDEAVYRAIIQRARVEQEAQRRRQNWETAGRLLAFSQYIEEQERKQAQEKQRRERIEAIQTLQALGMLNLMGAGRR